MTMDIQKSGRGEHSTPDLKMSLPNSVEEPKSSEYQSRTQYNCNNNNNNNRTVKRSFDVAFLMMPDEKLKQKQMEKQLRVSKQIFADNHYADIRKPDYKSSSYSNRDAEELKGTDLTTAACYNDKYRQNNNVSPINQDTNIDVGTDEFATKSVLSDSDVSDMSRSRPNSTDSFSRPQRVIHESPYRNKVFDDPSLISHRSYDDKYLPSRFSDLNPRSAFTKVTNSFNNPASSPGHSESPDNLSYQNSMSPPLTTSSPPMNIFSQKQPFKSLIPPNHPFLAAQHSFFKSQNLQTYQNQFADHHQSAAEFKGSQPNYSHDKNDNEKNFQGGHKFGHLLPFRPEISPYLQSNSTPYSFPIQGFHHPSADFLKFPQQSDNINPLIRNPAAAILSTLLPPTLATLSMPAQNICAKCNISFRMTSDLVYHMRSHHKSDVTYDSARRKREEKLKCPVCAESFRERHHLTRHMTAHQDKEGDILDHQLDSVESGSNFCKSKNRPYYGMSNGMHQK